MKNYYIYDIKWDTDDVEQSEYELPSNMLLECEDPDAIADVLSDTFGFCVETFNYDNINLTTLRRLVKNKSLFFDFREEREDDKKDCEEVGEEWKDEYSFYVVGSITDKYQHSWINSQFQGRRYEGIYVMNAEDGDVDPLLFKKKDIKIVDSNTLEIKDCGFHDGVWRLFTITDKI